MKKNIFLLVVSALIVSGCSQVQLGAHIAKQINPPPSVGTFKVGNPYKIFGITYYPKEEYKFVETGIASWYGAQFHGKKTANGEIYDMNALTAAHRTLQMPSLVRVTNLENGRSLIVRINDRGPYKRGRVIDLSRKAADLLGYLHQGTAKVKIEVLEKESRAISEAARRGIDTSGVEIAMNQGRQPALIQQAETVQASAPAQTVQASSVPPVDSEPLILADPGESLVQKVIVPPTDIYIQAGAYTVEDNALKQAAALSRIRPAKVYPAVVNGQQFYRVRLGPFPNVTRADAALADLLGAGNEQAIIIVE